MFSGRFDVKAKHQRTTKPLIDLTRGEQRNMKANKDAGNDNRRLMRQAAQTLAAEQVGLIGKAETRIRQMSVMELDHRHAHLQIQFMLGEEAMQDPILTSTAAKRLFARGHNFAGTPAPSSLDAIHEELDRLQFRVLGSVMRKVLEKKPSSGLSGRRRTRFKTVVTRGVEVRVSVFISGSWVQKILSPRCAFEYKYDAATIVLPIKSWACPSFCAALSTFREKQKLDFLLSSVCCRSNSEGRCSNCLGADRGSGGSRPA